MNPLIDFGFLLVGKRWLEQSQKSFWGRVNEAWRVYGAGLLAMIAVSVIAVCMAAGALVYIPCALTIYVFSPTHYKKWFN